MKKTILTLIISLLTTYSLAETGKFNASGAGSWAVNVMDGGNGNMSITYDGNAGPVSYTHLRAHETLR